MLTRLCLSLLALCTLLTRAPDVRAQGFGPATPASHVSVSLISSRSVLVPGEIFYVAIEQVIAPDWHTYWRNSGDSGQATSVSWTLPQGATAGAIEWPAPQAIPFGPLVNYGYSTKVTLPVAITLPPDMAIGTPFTLTGEVSWLECSDICIPGGAQVSLTLPVAAKSEAGPEASRIEQARARLPQPMTGQARLTDLGAGGLQLVIQGLPTPKAATFFPYELKSGALIDYGKAQDLVAGKDGFGLSLVKSPSFPKSLKGPIGGVLQLGTGEGAKAYEVTADFVPAPIAEQPVPSKAAAPAPPGLGLWLAIGMAFLGGLILNLMPCVFPILSMKALGLLAAAHLNDARTARAHGLWYGAGVMATFLAFGGVLSVLNAGGAALGWGFQMQSPVLVLVLATAMVVLGFNLLGFLELGTELQGLGQNLGQGQSGSHTSFWTGLLAVIVAAPCTAPFMGAALGFAATQPPLVALAIFGALGLGFALPFVALTFVPALMRALPKPGPWMARFREFLAFPMFATAIWLIWVIAAQAGQAGVLAALIAILAVAFGVWIKHNVRGSKGLIAAALVSATGIVWAGQHIHQAQISAAARGGEASGDAQIWSPDRVASLRAQGKTVFVNFTADWCVTCKVNELTVFSDARVATALSGGDVVYLVADWTARDPEIAQALSDFGRVGVPLYVVYEPGSDAPRILPQILTPKIVLDAVKGAAPSGAAQSGPTP